MSLRERLNQNAKGVTIAIACVAVLAIGLGWWEIRSSANASASLSTSSAYFTDDDGKTYFVGQSDQIVPFQHNGKTAYLATVIQCGKEAPRVAYLLRYSPAAIQQIEQVRKSGQNIELATSSIIADGSEVRRPGEEKWLPIHSAAAAKVLKIECPNNQPVQFVTP